MAVTFIFFGNRLDLVMEALMCLAPTARGRVMLQDIYI